jgi:hypothetical protein
VKAYDFTVSFLIDAYCYQEAFAPYPVVVPGFDVDGINHQKRIFASKWSVPEGFNNRIKFFA